MRPDPPTSPSGHGTARGSSPWSRPAVGRPSIASSCARAAAALHLAELREGTWTRPDNLDPERLPTSRAVIADQCVQFRHAATDLAADDLATLFDLDAWATNAERLIAAIDDEVAAARPKRSPTC